MARKFSAIIVGIKYEHCSDHELVIGSRSFSQKLQTHYVRICKLLWNVRAALHIYLVPAMYTGNTRGWVFIVKRYGEKNAAFTFSPRWRIILSAYMIR